MMKRSLVVLLLVLTAISNSFAQKDAPAKLILTQVSKKYRSYDVIKAEFNILIDIPQNKKQTQAATLYVQSKTNKYRMILSEQELISDGKTLWTYLKEDKEVQVSDADNSSEAINPARIFTIYETGYKYFYTGDTKSNKRVIQNIELSPIDPKSHYFKIRLGIDKLLKQISEATVFDKNGSRYTYSVKTFVPNIKVTASMFTFDSKKYPGIELVDLR